MEIYIVLACHGISVFLYIMTAYFRENKPIEKKNAPKLMPKLATNWISDGKNQKINKLKLSFCAICMDDKPIEDMFKNKKCSHSFCYDCVGNYLATKIQENITMVKCPDPKCNDTLEPYDCISILPKDVFERWENALVENLVLGSQKIYCPFKDCSAMLVNDGNQVVTVSECPYCNRLFCVQCKVSWHAGVDCRRFRSAEKSKKDSESEFVKLAKRKKWKRCSNCNYYVERREGCNQMTYRCGHQFCYICGSKWKPSHYECVVNVKLPPSSIVSDMIKTPWRM